MAELQAGTRIGRYCVEARLGQGAFATVYLVRHDALRTLHAMKVLAKSDRWHVDRLMREGRVAAQIRHPNIVGVSDIVDLDDIPALVMDYVAGPTLDAALAKVPLTLDQIDDVARGLIAGMACAHRAGLVHRDLKPANVLLEITGDGVRPRICDFGLAKARDAAFALAESTRTGAFMGSPCYMAPEQIADAKGVDHRADIWAIGAILYEMSVGQRAFDASSIEAVLRKVSLGEYPPLRPLRADLPERWARAIDNALVVDPDRRTATCDALMTAWIGEPTKAVWTADVVASLRAVGPAVGSDVVTVDRAPDRPVSATYEPSAQEAPPSIVATQPEAEPAAPLAKVPVRGVVRRDANSTQAAVIALGGLFAVLVGAAVLTVFASQWAPRGVPDVDPVGGGLVPDRTVADDEVLMHAPVESGGSLPVEPPPIAPESPGTDPGAKAPAQAAGADSPARSGGSGPPASVTVQGDGTVVLIDGEGVAPSAAEAPAVEAPAIEAASVAAELPPPVTAPPSPNAVVPTRPGTVLVNAPARGRTIVVDGTASAYTTPARIELPAGSHLIEVDGYRGRTVEVKAGTVTPFTVQ